METSYSWKQVVFFCVVAWLGVNLVSLAACYANNGNTSAHEYQVTNYDFCVEGVPQENARFWRKQCLIESGTQFPAPLFSVFKSVDYYITRPNLDQIIILSLETEEAQVYRTLVATVSQTLPVGKRIEYVARVHSMELDGVCVFFDRNGKVTSISDSCDTHEYFHWRSGQAGFDARYQTRREAEEITAEITFDLPIATTYDWWGSLFNRPQ